MILSKVGIIEMWFPFMATPDLMKYAVKIPTEDLIDEVLRKTSYRCEYMGCGRYRFY